MDEIKYTCNEKDLSKVEKNDMKPVQPMKFCEELGHACYILIKKNI